MSELKEEEIEWEKKFNKLTEQQKEELEKEYKELTEWVFSEESKLTQRLKAENRYVGGLDGNSKDFAYIYTERNKRIREMREKYGLSN